MRIYFIFVVLFKNVLFHRALLLVNFAYINESFGIKINFFTLVFAQVDVPLKFTCSSRAVFLENARVSKVYEMSRIE